MKHTFTGMMIALILTLALVIGAVALAEVAGPEAPAAGQAQPQQMPAAPEAPAEGADADSTALQEALKAYDEAKSSSRQEALEAELKSYVESGKLTQEQADLILNYYREQQALRDGTCPSCGYQFRNGQGKGGRMNGGKGNRMNGNMNGMDNRMNGGFGGKGGRGMMDRQPSQDQSTGSADGMSFAPDIQAAPDMTGDEST